MSERTILIYILVFGVGNFFLGAGGLVDSFPFMVLGIGCNMWAFDKVMELRKK